MTTMRKCPNSKQKFKSTALWYGLFWMALLFLANCDAFAQGTHVIGSSVKAGSTTLIGWLGSFFTVNVLPNLEGALLLLGVSALVSTLTFHSELKRSELSTKGSTRYLILWIFGNYIIALILLVLFLPEDKGFNLVDRQFFLYCILAAGMPELSAYLKVQLGNTKQGINLYKYREMFTQFIAKRVDSLSVQSEWQDSYLLKSVFWGRTQELCEKLTMFSNVSGLNDEEKIEVLNCLPAEKDENPENCVEKLFKLAPEIQMKLLNYFRDDVRRYEQSARAKLEKKLYPPLSVGEAEQLVSCGVIGPMNFFIKTTGSRRRKKLAETTHIDLSKLSRIHNEIKDLVRHRIKRATVGIVAFLVFLTAITFFVGFQMGDTASSVQQSSVEEPLE